MTFGFRTSSVDNTRCFLLTQTRSLTWTKVSHANSESTEQSTNDAKICQTTFKETCQ